MDGRVQYFKDCNFPQFTYKFNMISREIPVAFFKELDKNKLKNCKRKGGRDEASEGRGGKKQGEGLILLNIGTR